MSILRMFTSQRLLSKSVAVKSQPFAAEVSQLALSQAVDLKGQSAAAKSRNRRKFSRLLLKDNLFLLA